LPPGSEVIFTATETVAGKTSALSNPIDPIIPLTGGQSGTTAATNSNAPVVGGIGLQNAIDSSGISFDAQTTLGYSPNSNVAGGTLSFADGSRSAKIALLGNYIASSFELASHTHAGTMVVAEATDSGNQSLLTHPHHA
jgi:hypothetical protein